MPAVTRLSLLTFPQHWDGAKLHLRFTALPRGNPLDPLTGDLPAPPAFADAALKFELAVIPSLEHLPRPGDVTDVVAIGELPPAGRRVAFKALETAAGIAPPAVPPRPRRNDVSIRKYLPETYRDAFAFVPGRTPGCVTDDSYMCAIRDARPRPLRPRRKQEMPWGKALALALRQPLLAQRLGILYDVTLALPRADLLADGGWVFVRLTDDSAYAALAAATPDLVRAYAARLPALTAARTLFAAVVLPVVPVTPPGADYDTIAQEAESFDDGFAKIVHAMQPRTATLAATSDNGLPPAKDAGIRLGWDDEQTTAWTSRQLTADPIVDAMDVPMTVSGYRVDVREHGDTQWHSLARVQGDVTLGTLRLGHFNGETSTQVWPTNLDGTSSGDFWLPSYFATWNGSSIVLVDKKTTDLYGNPTTTAEGVYAPVDIGAVPLHYGTTYEFRVRLMDVSGGGPDWNADAVNPAPAPVATCQFRRFVPPKPLSVENRAEPADRAAPRTAYRIFRPTLGFPDLLYTGAANALELLEAQSDLVRTNGGAIELPDPDVSAARIVVSVRGLGFDADRRDDGYVTLYETTRTFPDDPEAPLDVDVTYVDAPDIASFPADAGTGALLLPTARDVRIAFAAECREDPTLAYFGSQDARRSTSVSVVAGAASRDEGNLFVPSDDTARLRGIMLQPDPILPARLDAAQAPPATAPDVAHRLAQALDLDVSDLLLLGKPGRRTVIGASGAIRHTLAPNGSSIRFSAKGDLVGHWLCVVDLTVARDWTWDGLADRAFSIERDGSEVGTIDLRRDVSPVALSVPPDRSATRIVFIDAVDPKPAPGTFPHELVLEYTIRPHFRNAPVNADAPLNITLRLPIAAPPSQVPRIASAGIALGPYAHDAGYAATEPRTRMLWLELEEPVANPDDALFARVLSAGDDPLLVTPITGGGFEMPEPGLDLDPEAIRIIHPLQSADDAGLSAMQRLIASSSPRHVGLPLPPGVDAGSPDLFQFYTYEFRVGHARKWSTAQARFGPPLRATGLQHPAPELPCEVTRTTTQLVATCPFARPNASARWNGQRPRTELWALLYAQALQLDGAAHRNILLARRRAIQDERERARVTDVFAHAFWSQAEIGDALAALALDRDSSLSVLAVETLPEVGHFADPLGASLGQVRILRTSLLTPVPAIC